eukprot:6208221-Pleurochrysis_carterae.AAC.1
MDTPHSAKCPAASAPNHRLRARCVCASSSSRHTHERFDETFQLVEHGAVVSVGARRPVDGDDSGCAVQAQAQRRRGARRGKSGGKGARIVEERIRSRSGGRSGKWSCGCK